MPQNDKKSVRDDKFKKGFMKSLSIQIGIFGKTNAGKSSLMNFITGQDASVVSEVAGTTTDVVSKQMELNPLGPVTFFDTAGLNDSSELGKARIEKTNQTLDSSDVVLLMCEADNFNKFEESIVKGAKKRKTPLIIIVSKTDLKKPSKKFLEQLKSYSSHILSFSAKNSDRDDFLNDLKKILVSVLPDNFIEEHFALKSILKKDDTAILVVPIDSGAPRGKLIMPQVLALRQILDLNACAYVLQDSEYKNALDNLKTIPYLVIADSQVIKNVAAQTPSYIRLTSFSILSAADKGDIVEMAKGAAALQGLKSGDKVLIAEACTHHAMSDDIGKVKIPQWLKEFANADIIVKHSSGADFPKDLKSYKLVIHCGGCTLNRKGMLARINKAAETGVPITNYGIAIAVFGGVIDKVLEVFPEALKAYKSAVEK